MDLFYKLRNITILLIDDDEWIRDSLCIFFESDGCHVTALETTEEGMGAIRKQAYDIFWLLTTDSGYGWSGVSQACSRYTTI